MFHKSEIQKTEKKKLIETEKSDLYGHLIQLIAIYINKISINVCI